MTFPEPSGSGPCLLFNLTACSSGYLHLQPTPKHTAPMLCLHRAHADLPTWNCLPASASPERCSVPVQFTDEETKHIGRTTPHRAWLSFTWPQSQAETTASCSVSLHIRAGWQVQPVSSLTSPSAHRLIPSWEQWSKHRLWRRRELDQKVAFAAYVLCDPV